MRSIARRSMFVAAAAVLALAACGDKASAGKSGDAGAVLGNAKAPVTVVEYASVTCGHCAAWNEEVWPEFKKKYVDTGQVRYEFREFLTPPQDVAAAGFLVARCAGDDKYMQVVDAIMRSQQEIYQTGDARGVLRRVAQSAGMSDDQFRKCVSDEAALKALNARVEKAYREEGVQSTPTFYVNGKKLEGAQPMAALDAAIAEAKKK